MVPIAGLGSSYPTAVDGPGLLAEFNGATGVTHARREPCSHRQREQQGARISTPTGASSDVTTLAGGGLWGQTPSCSFGTTVGRAASMSTPNGLVFGPNGTLYVTMQGCHKVAAVFRNATAARDRLGWQRVWQRLLQLWVRLCWDDETASASCSPTASPATARLSM